MLVRTLAILVAVVGIGLVADAFWWEPSSISVVRHPIKIHRIDAAPYNKLRVAVIADLHAGSLYIDAKKIDRIVALTNEQKPDIVLLAGDYVTTAPNGAHRKMTLEAIAPHLAKLKASLGVYALIGNHDRWDGAEHAIAVLSNSGLTVLENNSRTLSFHGKELQLVGIGDYYTHAFDIKKSFSRVSENKPALCFTHSPDVFPLLPQACFLTIAGHTHGGQVTVPFLGRPIVPSQYGQRFASGHITENGRELFVSTGIGTVGPPVRFGVTPEISLVEVEVHG